jgi:hypothetical protein
MLLMPYVANGNVDEMYIAPTLKYKIIRIYACERYMVRVKFIPDFQQHN